MSQIETGAGVREGFLAGIRVVEVADELGEYCGQVLAGLGAEVIKVEPAQGERTRAYGPFAEAPDGTHDSLYFWHYNLSKKSVRLDLADAKDQETYLELARTADIVLDARSDGGPSAHGLGYERVRQVDPSVIYARITAFGEDGPWSHFVGSDLVHLALGGVMMNCGYDPTPDGTYDTPPIAPQMWQAYQITGETMAIALIGALIRRLKTGRGQKLSSAVHDAVSKNTETDLPDWVYLRQEHWRQTCRHSMPQTNAPALSMTKDGRWLLPYRTYLRGFVDVWKGSLNLLKKFDMQVDLESPHFQRQETQDSVAGRMHMADAIDKLICRFKSERDLWVDGQGEGLPWAPIRRPEENVKDRHWQARGTFAEVYSEKYQRDVTQVAARWVCAEVPWHLGDRAPELGEHDDAWQRTPRPLPVVVQPFSGTTKEVTSPHGKPFALPGVRVLDLGWLLASAGAGRFFTALGAEVIKVEHSSRWDAMRWGTGMVPPGGRRERDAATEALPVPESESPNRGGAFMEINAGKMGISLNLKSDEGKALLRRLIAVCDVVIDGFSPGTLTRMGFGYDVLQEINPSIVCVHQSGMGEAGTYGGLRSYGPTAQAFSGLSDMSGLPAPYPPAGIGYSYLDWFGAYNVATAMMAGLYRRAVTGLGCQIDASQVEMGIYLSGTTVLEWSLTGRAWERYGNNPPYKPAAPQGAYPAEGRDRWLALSCFTQEQWLTLADTLGLTAAEQHEFASFEVRQARADELDRLVASRTSGRDAYELMEGLQRRSVPAGVCQTVQDRCERDRQLEHLGWLVELPQAEIGTWPVKEVPVSWSETPPYIGGRLNRSGPSYAEDNHRIFGDLLGIEPAELERLDQMGTF